MPKIKENNLYSILPKVNAFYWSINLNMETISFDNSALAILGENFQNKLSIANFCKHLNENCKNLIKDTIEKAYNDDLQEIQLNVTIKSNKKTVNAFMSGTRSESDSNIIEGIGLPANNVSITREKAPRLEASILEKAPIMICLTDIKGNIFYVNPEFTKTTGYSSDELITRNSRLLKSGFHSNDFYKNLWDTLNKGNTWEGKILNRRKNGSQYWEKAVIAPYYDNQTNFNGFIKASEDITDQEKTKKQLKAERNLFLAGPVVVLKWDPSLNGVINYTSPNIKDVFGYEAEEFVNDINYIDIIHPDDRERIVKDTQKYIDLNQNISFKQSYRIKTKPGTYKHIIDQTSIERDEGNEIINFSGYLIDNTEFIEAQKELEKNESKYKDVFNTAGVGIIYTNKEGIIVDANRKFDELVFAEPGQLIGKSAMELINTRLPGNSARELLSVLFHILKGNRIDPREINIANKYYEIQSDYNPHLQTNIGILRDITEQKIAAQKVEESEQKYKYLVDNMNDGIVITDENENLTFMNEASKQIFEADIDSFESGSIIDVATETSADIIRHQEDIRKSGEASTYYIEIVTQNGTKKNIEVNASPLFKDSEFNGSFGILRDITEQVRADMELKSAYSQMKLINRKLQEHAKELEIAKEKAEESDRLKTAFLANISHEIRTPMNGIVGFAQLTMNASLTEEKRNTYLQIITDSTMQLESVVMDIIDLSKIEGGEAKFNKKDIETEDIILEAFENNRTSAESKDINYIYVNKDILPTLNTDKTRFKQVINILLGNAIKFTAEGQITLECKVTNSHIEISVSDTGIGIAKEYQEVIFEPFRQVEIAMKRKFGGTGLGLTIAKKIAQTFGGDILLESELDKGSTFTFTHPM
jgi:PAS domain S-box-containing protein